MECSVYISLFSVIFLLCVVLPCNGLNGKNPMLVSFLRYKLENGACVILLGLSPLRRVVSHGQSVFIQ